MPQSMRKTTNMSSELVERARELGVRVPLYSIPSAQADAADLTDVREVAEKIVRSVVAREATAATPVGQDEPEQPKRQLPNGSGRSSADRRVIKLNI